MPLFGVKFLNLDDSGFASPQRLFQSNHERDRDNAKPDKKLT